MINLANPEKVALDPRSIPLRRTAPFEEEPGFYEPAGLWLYGNVKLLDSKLVCLAKTFGRENHSESSLNAVEREAEMAVLDGQILVCGVHNSAHQRSALVPLRWGAPRIVVLSGGFHHHLGKELSQEPFRVARLWRYEWDRHTDLAVSLRAPDKLPTFATHNPTVDRLITRIVSGNVNGLLFQKPLQPLLAL